MVLENMDFSRIQNVVFKSDPQPQTMFLNDGVNLRNLVMSDSTGGYDFVPINQPMEQRILIMDDQGVLREAFTDVSYLLSQNLPMYQDDMEIPPHVLDHMYAKKPREPGSEQTPAKPRRRAKRKEQVVEQFIIPDAQPAAPKINIIRQRLPSSVYKPITARPKILYGSPQKTSTTTGSGFGNSLASSPTKGKQSPAKQSGHLGRTNKKDEPSKTMYASFDDVNKLFTSNKVGKDSKSCKLSSKLAPNSSTIIMDDLQRVGAAYDEEMLFDFGITEDDDNDEAIACTLGTDGFSDGEFDEFGVAGMDAYTNSTQNSIKASSLSKSPTPTSGILLSQRSQIKPSTHPQLSSEISDDEDSNQIMVSIHNNGRPSQDWDSVQLFDQTLKKESTEMIQSNDLCVATNDKQTAPANKCVDQTKNKLPVEFKESGVLKTESNVNGASSSNSKDVYFSFVAASATFTKKESPLKSAKTLNTNPTMRRSSRVVKTPAWLEDSDNIPIAKRQRKKSSA